MKLQYQQNRMQLLRTTMLQMDIILIAILFVTVDCKCKSKDIKQTTINPIQKTKETKNVNGHLSVNVITKKPVSSSLLTFCRVVMKNTIPKPTANLATWTNFTRCPQPRPCPHQTPSRSDCSRYTLRHTSPLPTPSPQACICHPTPAPVDCSPCPCICPTPSPFPIGRLSMGSGSDDMLSDDDEGCEFDSSADHFTINYITTFVMCGIVFAMHFL